MKLKLRHIIIINIILVIIIILNYASFNKKKIGVFERDFVSTTIPVIEKRFLPLNESTSRMISSSNNMCITEKVGDSTNILSYDFNSKAPILSHKLISTENFNLYFDKNSLYSINKGLLHVNNSPVKKLENIKILNLTIVNNKVLALAELHSNNVFNLGFYSISLSDYEINEVKSLKESKISLYPEYFLSYMGNFSSSEDNTIIYACSKSSFIWVFKSTDDFLNEFQTKDNTPFPKILSTGEMYYFERGKTFNTNMSSFIKNDNVYIFSNRTENKNVIILDKYDFKGNYINSYKIKIDDKESNDILSIFKEKNKIAIAYNNYISLISVTSL